MIKSVNINHAERNYFEDYTELRTDVMVRVEPERICKALDKMTRRHKRGYDDCMFLTMDDGTGYRIMYEGDELYVRHYTHMMYASWDHEEAMATAKVKRMIRRIDDDE